MFIWDIRESLELNVRIVEDAMQFGTKHFLFTGIIILFISVIIKIAYWFQLQSRNANLKIFAIKFY